MMAAVPHAATSANLPSSSSLNSTALSSTFHPSFSAMSSSERRVTDLRIEQESGVTKVRLPSASIYNTLLAKKISFFICIYQDKSRQ
jgi:hypothetical protein